MLPILMCVSLVHRVASILFLATKYIDLCLLRRCSCFPSLLSVGKAVCPSIRLHVRASPPLNFSHVEMYRKKTQVLARNHSLVNSLPSAEFHPFPNLPHNRRHESPSILLNHDIRHCRNGHLSRLCALFVSFSRGHGVCCVVVVGSSGLFVAVAAVLEGAEVATRVTSAVLNLDG